MGLIPVLFAEVYSVDLCVSLGVHGLVLMPLGLSLLFKSLQLSLIFCIILWSFAESPITETGKLSAG